MAMSSLMTDWLERLHGKGVLQGNLLEFGPQDLTTSPEKVLSIARRIWTEDEAINLVKDIYHLDGDQLNVKQRYHTAFYKIYGLTEYKSLDPFEEISEYRQDLNFLVDDIEERFQTITNFGTAEHCFNIGNVFKTAYDLLNVNGVLLNVLPTYGDIDHGFYNIHPVVYKNLCLHSGFELIDFQYIDDLQGKTIRSESNLTSTFDFDSLSLKWETLRDNTPAANISITNSYIQNVTATSRPVVDYCFVALRKISDGPFRLPYQYGLPERRS